MAKPDRGAVLVTRPEPGAGQTAVRLIAMGLTPILAPALVIRPLALTRPPNRVAAILATSGNALSAFDASWHATPFLAVGDATAERARTQGFSQVLSAGGDAVALTALTRAWFGIDDGVLLLASGRGQGLELAAGLRGLGYRVVRRVTYAAEPATTLPADSISALRARTVDTALFFSPATARHCIRLLSAAGLAACAADMVAVAISARTAMALQTLSWRRIDVARNPDQDAMLALLR